MENDKLIKALQAFGHILAEHARVQGMIAENTQRLICDQSIAYVYDSFATSAEIIDSWADKIK